MKKTKYSPRSGLAPAINGCLDFREKLGYARTTYESNLMILDKYFFENYPELATLTKESVLNWISSRTMAGNAQLTHDAIAVRHLAEHIKFTGQPAYMLPPNFVPKANNARPYLFTDDELSRLFAAIDRLEPQTNSCAFHPHIAPVLFRLIYTCGLRPNEGRELLRTDVDLETGEILIRHNRCHKERLVVMSDDMLELCREYNEKLKIHLPDGKLFFPYKNDILYTNEGMTRLFRKCWAKANPTINDSKDLPRVRVYDLRHRFASSILNRWLDEKCDLYAKLPYLRAYMGHDEISATSYYIHILPENIIKSQGVDWDVLDNILPEVL